MATTTSSRIPFSGVDSLMRALDEPGRPQTIELEVAVTKSLDEQRLRDAVADAASRHPMARARQLPARLFDLEFAWKIGATLTGDAVSACSVGTSTEVDVARDAFLSRHIDLETEAPFRVLLIHEAGQGDRVMLSVNHAAFDGIGAFRLMQSISRSYAGEADPLPDVDPLEVKGLLEKKHRKQHRGPALGTGAPLQMAKPPARLASKPGEAKGFRVLHLDLDAADAPSQGGATVNDVLLVALHQTIDRWNRSQGQPCDRVAVMMPVNQRPAAWRDEVLANLVLPGRVESSKADRSTTAGLLAAVKTQTKQIKSKGVNDSGTDSMPRYAPVALRRLMPHLIDAVSPLVADTAVLSNLGLVADPPWFGAKGRGLWFGPPPRDPVVLTVGVGTAEGRLGVSLRWCDGLLSASAVQEFADLFVAALSELREL
ncbi:MAG: hypothetical protein ACR2MB_14905 [Acidimicrobiales bacterium]